jgi:hypothetical protein
MGRAVVVMAVAAIRWILEAFEREGQESYKHTSVCLPSDLFISSLNSHVFSLFDIRWSYLISYSTWVVLLLLSSLNMKEFSILAIFVVLGVSGVLSLPMETKEKQ